MASWQARSVVCDYLDAGFIFPSVFGVTQRLSPAIRSSPPRTERPAGGKAMSGWQVRCIGTHSLDNVVELACVEFCFCLWRQGESGECNANKNLDPTLPTGPPGDHLDVLLGKRGYVVLGVGVEEGCAILCAGLAGIAPDAIRDNLVSLPHMVFLSHLELKLEMRGRRERPVDGGINSLDRTLCVQEVPLG